MKKREIIIILIIAVIGIGFFVYTRISSPSGHVVVYYHKKKVETIDTDVDKTYTFKGDVGTFHLQVKNGRYRAYDVDCPNQICVHTGWVKAGEEKSIVCAPNGISVVYET